MNKQEIAAKIEWEGGIAGALEWGLKIDDISEDDPELRTAFAELYQRWRGFDQASDRFAALLPLE